MNIEKKIDQFLNEALNEDAVSMVLPNIGEFGRTGDYSVLVNILVDLRDAVLSGSKNVEKAIKMVKDVVKDGSISMLIKDDPKSLERACRLADEKASDK